MKLRNPFRRGRHRRDQPEHVSKRQPRSFDCCDHCRHPLDPAEHEYACPQGCNGPVAEGVTLAWLAEVGALTYWPQHEPEHDGWLAAQLGDFRAWAADGWAFIDRWHDQAEAAAGRIDRILYLPGGITQAAII